MLKLSKRFKPLFHSDKRYNLCTGGRGSSKSFTVSSFLSALSFEEEQKILFTRQTMTSAYLSIIPEFTEKIELMQAEPLFDITKAEIINRQTKSEIIFRGIQSSRGTNTANLKSLNGVTCWVVDEAEEMVDEEIFDTIDLSIRHKTVQNRVLLVMNPSNAEHFIYKKFIENSQESIDVDGVDVQISTHPDVCHIHTTYLDNKKNLPKQFLDIIERIKDESIRASTVNGVFSRALFNKSKYAYKIIGRWADVAEGVIFTNWEEGEFDESLPYAYGQDYGFSVDPDSLIKVAVDKKRMRVYVHEEYYKRGQLSTDDLYTMNKSRIKYPNDLIIADSAEPRLIADLKKKGLNIEECEKGPGSVVAGITDLLNYTIVVTPSSMNIKKELRNYRWNDKKAGIPVDDHNHSIDPIRYAHRKLTGQVKQNLNILSNFG